MKATELAQVGAVPVRGARGSYEVLLVTSRDSGRWIIPKGWPMKGKKDHAAAAQEAFEEAGVVGRIHKRPVGAYAYDKRTDGEARPVRVMVYLLEVREEKNAWPEGDQRRRAWMTLSDAAAAVAEPGLAELLQRLGGHEERALEKVGRKRPSRDSRRLRSPHTEGLDRTADDVAQYYTAGGSN